MTKNLECIERIFDWEMRMGWRRREVRWGTRRSGSGTNRFLPDQPEDRQIRWPFFFTFLYFFFTFFNISFFVATVFCDTTSLINHSVWRCKKNSLWNNFDLFVFFTIALSLTHSLSLLSAQQFISNFNSATLSFEVVF